MRQAARRYVRRRAWLLPALGAVACFVGGNGGSAVPRGAPRLAEGSTPDPVRFEVVMAGRRPLVRSRVARILSDSLFHVNAADPAALSAYNLGRLTKVRVEVVPAGKDSMRVGLTGETYVGDTTRRDSISGLPERWRLITASDPTAALLRGLARAFRTGRVESTIAADATAASPGGGAGIGTTAASPGVPGTPTDPAVAATLARTPVGRASDVCRSAVVPTGWLVLYWRTDSTHCLGLPDQRYDGEPNVMHIEREW
jgi:hypothetical protein